MQITIDLDNLVITDIERDNNVIYKGDTLVSDLSVVSTTATSDYTVRLACKLSNGRIIEPRVADSTTTDSNSTTWSFTLSKANEWNMVAGKTLFYVWLYGATQRKCLGTFMVDVCKAVATGDQSYFVIRESDDADEVLTNLQEAWEAVETNFEALQTSVASKVDKTSTDDEEYPTTATITNANGAITTSASYSGDDNSYNTTTTTTTTTHSVSLTQSEDETTNYSNFTITGTTMSESVNEDNTDTDNYYSNTTTKTKSQTQEVIRKNYQYINTITKTYNSITETIADNVSDDETALVNTREFNAMHNYCLMGDTDEPIGVYTEVEQTRTTYEVGFGINGVITTSFKVDRNGVYVNNDPVLTEADKTELEASIATKQDTMTAGEGITLSNNTIAVDSTIAKVEDIQNLIDIENSSITYDPSTYTLGINLVAVDGTTLSKTIDLPIETLVMSASYSNGVITLTLNNGNTLDIDVSSLVSGLANLTGNNTFTATNTFNGDVVMRNVAIVTGSATALSVVTLTGTSVDVDNVEADTISCETFTDGSNSCTTSSIINATTNCTITDDEWATLREGL